jgi:acetate---CoA ligase (ADP-forming)
MPVGATAISQYYGMVVCDFVMQRREDIERLLHPRGVALIGPVDRNAPEGPALAALSARWGDAYHLVDPRGGALGNVPIHQSLADVPGPVELGVLNVGRDSVAAAIEECGQRGLLNVIVTAGGFREMGEAGAAEEQKLVEIAHRHGMRLLGPNANANAFDAMPPPVNPRIRKIGLITQSGHMGRLIFQSSPHGVAFSRWVPTGNEADLEAADFIEYFAYDDDTAVIAGYFEGFRSGAKLRKALAAANAQGKPVVLIKVGRQEAASRMASSHTAHLTGTDAVVDGLFRQYGAIRVDDVDELIETAALHAKLAPLPHGPRVALYGISGGAVALMGELAEASGITVPIVSEETQRRLHEVLPAHIGVSNPIDNGNLYRTGSAEERRRVLPIIAADPSVDLLVCALTGIIPGVSDNFVADIVGFLEVSSKPVVVIWNSWDMESPAYQVLVRSGAPIFRSFRNCFQSLHGYFEYQQRLEGVGARPPYEPPPAGPEAPHATRTLEAGESAALLRRFGVPIPEERMASSAAEATDAVEIIGYPVVLKAPVAGFPHKSDVGLVRTGLASAGEVRAAFESLRARVRELVPDAAAQPIMVQRQVAPGTEVIIGITRDATLGPAILVGLGGIFTEVLRDVSVRPLPITEFDAGEMIHELKGFLLLEGVRGTPKADLQALTETILAVARLAADPDTRVVELDLNPVIAGPAGCVAVDSLIVVASA